MNVSYKNKSHIYGERKSYFCIYFTCRYGVLSGHRRAHTRGLSQILTAHQDSGSSAPSPTRVNSQSTLVVKRILPWTLDISVNSGDTSLLSVIFQQGVKWTIWKIAWDTDKVSLDWDTRITETLNALPLHAYQSHYQDKMFLLYADCSNFLRFSTRTCLSKQLSSSW